MLYRTFLKWSPYKYSTLIWQTHHSLLSKNYWWRLTILFAHVSYTKNITFRTPVGIHATLFYFLPVVDISQTEHARTSITINIENVPTPYADVVVPMVLEALNDIVATENLDMDRMYTLIDRERLKVTIKYKL